MDQIDQRLAAAFKTALTQTKGVVQPRDVIPGIAAGRELGGAQNLVLSSRQYGCGGSSREDCHGEKSKDYPHGTRVAGVAARDLVAKTGKACRRAGRRRKPWLCPSSRQPKIVALGLEGQCRRVFA